MPPKRSEMKPPNQLVKTCSLLLLVALASCTTQSSLWKKEALPQTVLTERVRGCEATPSEEGLVVTAPTNDRSFVQTGKEFRPPFSVHFRAKTDSTNIRLYYNAGMVILNWERKPSELRFHDFTWDILEERTRLQINGEVVVSIYGDYGNLESAIGIGPAFGSELTIQSFRVEEY